MDNYQKFGLVSGQVLMGLIFGFGGVIVASLVGTVYEELTGNYTRDLSTHIIYALYGGFIGMQIGIGYNGYKYLKAQGRLKYFNRFFVQSVFGFVTGLLMFYCFFLSLGHINSFLEGLLAYLAPVMPMVGAIIGFDFGLVKKLNENKK